MTTRTTLTALALAATALSLLAGGTASAMTWKLPSPAPVVPSGALVQDLCTKENGIARCEIRLPDQGLMESLPKVRG